VGPGLIAAAGAGALVGVVAWPLTALAARWTDSPYVDDGSVRGIPWALGVVMVAYAVSVLVVRSWIPRPLSRFLLVWMGGRAVCFVAAVAFGALLLYSAPLADRAVIGLVIAAGYMAVLAAESAVLTRRLRRVQAGQSA